MINIILVNPDYIKSDESITQICYEDSISYNLKLFADNLGIYQHIWRPSEIGITKASELIGILDDALLTIRSNSKRFETLSTLKDYNSFYKFLKSYYEACMTCPDAKIITSN